MLTKTLVVIAVACLLTACESQAPVADTNALAPISEPHEQPDCPSRDDSSTACR